MDLGATICRPAQSALRRLPAAPIARPLPAATPEAFPERSSAGRPHRYGIAYWIERDGHVWLVRRPPRACSAEWPRFRGANGPSTAARRRTRHRPACLHPFLARPASCLAPSPSGDGWWQPSTARRGRAADALSPRRRAGRWRDRAAPRCRLKKPQSPVKAAQIQSSRLRDNRETPWTIASTRLPAGCCSRALSCSERRSSRASCSTPSGPRRWAIRSPAWSRKARAAAPPSSRSKLYLANADATKGEQIFNKCIACHNADNGGANQLGPNLWGMVGDPIGHGKRLRLLGRAAE